MEGKIGIDEQKKTKKLNGHKHYFYIFSEVEGSDLAKTSEFSSVTQQNYYYYFLFVFLYNWKRYIFYILLILSVGYSTTLLNGRKKETLSTCLSCQSFKLNFCQNKHLNLILTF